MPTKGKKLSKNTGLEISGNLNFMISRRFS